MVKVTPSEQGSATRSPVLYGSDKPGAELMFPAAATTTYIATGIYTPATPFYVGYSLASGLPGAVPETARRSDA